jgi:hypothetical protein
MAKPSLATIEKLVMAGEDAGYTVEQMIDLLRKGLSLETLMDMIEWRLSNRIEAASRSLVGSCELETSRRTVCREYRKARASKRACLGGDVSHRGLGLQAMRRGARLW